jgi:hypothetical protein
VLGIRGPVTLAEGGCRAVRADRLPACREQPGRMRWLLSANPRHSLRAAPPWARLKRRGRACCVRSPRARSPGLRAMLAPESDGSSRMQRVLRWSRWLRRPKGCLSPMLSSRLGRAGDRELGASVQPAALSPSASPGGKPRTIRGQALLSSSVRPALCLGMQLGFCSEASDSGGAPRALKHSAPPCPLPPVSLIVARPGASDGTMQTDPNGSAASARMVRC